MKRTLAAIVALGLAGTAAAAPVQPNVMILLDSSGSMADPITVLPAYNPSTSYPNAGFTATTVYQQIPDGSEAFFAATVADVPFSDAQAQLSQYGFWFGVSGNVQLKLFTGNYLNYQNCSACKTSQSKISVARRVIADLVKTVTTTRFGLMDFINNGTQGTGNGGVVAQVGASSTTIINAVNGINPSGWTPTGEQLRDAGKYFSGTYGFPTPIQAQCQLNSVIIVSDGLQNGSIDVRAQATTEFNSDHSTVYSGVQNLITNTVGLTVDASASAVLQTAATNGHGSFAAADDSTQLEQALFTVPTGVSLTAPANLSLLSGVATLSAAVTNGSCIAGVQFAVDGSPVGPLVTASPYSYSWDTNAVLNGTHTITAVSQDIAGNTAVSQAILVITVNDQTAPVINNVNVSVGVTTATISWSTNKPADTQVRYGLTVSYDQVTLLQDASPKVTTHTVQLSGLTPGTQYHSEVLSRDSAGNLSILGDIAFVTQSLPAGGALDHFLISFLGQPGPGFKSGAYPYVVPAGSCFSASVEAFDNLGQHSNYNGPVTVGQYLLDDSGLETALTPGIAIANAFQLGVATMDVTMVNGFVFLGSNVDFTKQLCFYRATREPFDSKTPGANGDLHLRVIKTGDPTVAGVTASYVVWRGAPDRLALTAPGQSLAPATPAGVSGNVDPLSQGVPFALEAYVTDSYWNLVKAANDTLDLVSSLPLATSFRPQTAASAGGVLVSTVTVGACSGLTVTASDQTNSLISGASASLSIASCGTARYYDLVVPGAITAGQTFSMSIKVNNLNIPVGAGSTVFSGRLIPLVQKDASHYVAASSLLGVPLFSFSVPEGTSGVFVSTVPNQVYTKAETIYVQLAADNPSDLAGASVIAGPIVVSPAAPSKLTLTVSPSVVPAHTQAQITASLTDAFGNGIPGQSVLLALTSGSGKLGANQDLISQALNTDASGRAVFDFFSGPVSESDGMIASAPALPGVPQAQAQVLVSLLGDRIIAAYPSPVKIAERPLTVEYRLDQDSDVTLTFTDLFSRPLWQASYPAGTPGGKLGFNRISWNGQNGEGRAVAAGVYSIHMLYSANGQTQKAFTRFGIRK